MKITNILVYQVDLPLNEGRYFWTSGKYVDVFDSTIVCIQIDTIHEGWGETAL